MAILSLECEVFLTSNKLIEAQLIEATESEQWNADELH